MALQRYQFKNPFTDGVTTVDPKNSALRWNSALLMQGNRIVSRYDKNYSVPRMEENLQKGKRPGLFYLRGTPFGVQICFEDIFPSLARELTGSGAQFIVNISNDAWYAQTSGVLQHGMYAVFRAIENRISFLRVANRGVSEFVSPTGEILKSSTLDTQEKLTQTIPLYSGFSLYRLWGDIPALVVFIGLFFLFVRSLKIRFVVRAKAVKQALVGLLVLFSFLGWPFQVLAQAKQVGRIDATNLVARVTVSNDGKLYAFDKEGKAMAGWPKDFSSENRFFSFKPRLIDIDFDLQEEVVAVSQEKAGGGLRLHVFKGNGQEVLDWRFDLPQSDLLETPIIADVNHDSSLDIIFATKSNHVYVYRRDFRLLKSFALDSEPHISVGDPDNNGLEDLYVASGGNISRFDPLQSDIHRNELVPFPVPTGSEPILGNIAFEDVNHDSYPDLIYTTTANHIVAVDRNGQRILNIQPPQGQTIASGVAVEDIDLDREPEIIVLTETQDILAFETNGTQVANWRQPLLYRQPLPEGGIVANDIYQGLFSTATGWDLYTIYRNKLGGYSRILLGENIHDFDTKADFQFVEAVQITDAFAFPKLFTPNGDGVNDTVQIHYRLSDDALIALDLYDAHERFLSRILQKISRGAGEHQEKINGLDTKGTTTNKDDRPLDTGAYIIKVVAQSKEGFVTSSKVSVLVNGLKAEIEAPRDGANIFGKVTIQGVATDPNFGENNLDADFKAYKLYYRPGRWNISEEEAVAVGQSGSGWNPLLVPTRHQCPDNAQKEPADTEFPNSNVSCRPVQHGALGVFDAGSPATTPNGEYTILLKTLDSNGNTVGKIHFDTVEVNVNNPLGTDPYNAQDVFDPHNPNNPVYQGPRIAAANLSSRLISRENPSTTLTYTLQNETSNVHVDIFPVSGGSIAGASSVYSFNRQAPNTYNFVWDGTNTLGRNLDGGHYRVRITANAIDGTGVDVNESLEFDVARGFSARDILAVNSFVATPNHINPFNFGGNLQSEKMSLEFGLTKTAKVTVQVFDRLPEEGGTLLKTLMADQIIKTGGVLWDGTGNNGVILEAGRQYLVRLRAVGIDVGNDESVHQDIIVNLDQATLDPSLSARLDRLVGDVGEEFVNDGTLNAMVGSPDFIWRARAIGYVEVPFEYAISAYGDENYTRYSTNSATQPLYVCHDSPSSDFERRGDSLTRGVSNDGYGGYTHRSLTVNSDLPLQSFDVVTRSSGVHLFSSQSPNSQNLYNWLTSRMGGNYLSVYRSNGSSSDISANDSSTLPASSPFVQGGSVQLFYYAKDFNSSCSKTDTLCPTICGYNNGEVALLRNYIGTGNDLFKGTWQEAQFNATCPSPVYGYGPSAQTISSGIVLNGWLYDCGTITVTAHGSASATRSWSSSQPTSGNLSLNSLSTSLPATNLASFSASVGSGQSDVTSSWITGYNLSVTDHINGYANSNSSGGSTLTLPALAAWLNGGTLAAETRDNGGSRITTFDSSANDPFTLVAPYNKIWGWHRGFNRDQFHQYTNRINFYQNGYRPNVFNGDPERNLYTFSDVVHVTGWVVEVRYPNITVDKPDGDNPLNIPGGLNIFSLETPHIEGAGVRGNQNSNIEDTFRLKLLPEAQAKRFVEIHGSAAANYELYYYDADERDPKWHAIPSRTRNAVATDLLAHWDVTKLNGKNYTVVLKTINPASAQVNQDTFNIGIGKKVDTSHLESDQLVRVDTPFKRASLIFGAGALSEPELVTVNAIPRSEADFRLPSGVTPLGPIFQAKPDHIQIDSRYHVQLELVFTPEEIHDTFGVADPSELQIYNLAGDELLEGLATVVQLDTHDDADPTNDVYRFTANLEHFSQYFLAKKQVGQFYITNPTSDSFLKGTVTIAGRIEKDPRAADQKTTPGELAAITHLTIHAGTALVYEGNTAAFSAPWDVSQLEGNRTLLFVAEGADGAVTKYELPVAIDNQAGSSTLLVNGQAVAGGGTVIAGADAVVEVKADDDVSGTADIEYAWDRATLQTYSQPFTIPFAKGTHTIAYHAIDKNGNAEAMKEGMIQVEEKASDAETNPSQLSLAIAGPSFVQSNERWVTGETQFSITANETGLNNIRYRASDASYRDYTDPFALAGLKDGLYNIEYYAVDAMGLRGTVYSQPVILDTIAPVVTIDCKGNCQKSANIFLIDSQTEIILSGKDDGVQPVGLARIEYHFDSDTWAVYREPLHTANTRTLVYRAIDLLGNTSLDQSIQLKLDDTPPVVQISGMPSAISPNGDGRKDTVEFQVLATDNFSKNLTVDFVLIESNGVRHEVWNRKVLESQENINTLVWDGKIADAFLPEAVYSYEIKVVDAQGNVSQAQTGSLIYDLTPPQVTIANSGVSSFSPNGDNLSDILQVNYSVSDNLTTQNLQTELHIETPEGFKTKAASDRVNTPPAGHQFSWDGSNLANNPAFDGTYRFKIIAEDEAGNRSQAMAGQAEEGEGEIFIDRLAPKTEINISGATYKDQNKTWLGSNARMELKATDPIPASGVKEIQYRFGDTMVMGYTDPFTAPLPGIDYLLRYQSVDNVGNFEQEKTLNVRLDTTPPETDIAVGEPKLGDDQGATWISPATPITMTAQDPDGVGVKEIYFETPDVADTFVYKKPISLVGLSDGPKTIYYWAKDRVENVSAKKDLQVSLDGTPPVTKLIVGDPKVWEENLLYVTSATALDFQATTERNDLKTTEYQINEGAWLLAGPFQFPIEGNYTLGFRSHDTLENIEPTNLQKIVVDNTPPDPLLHLNQGEGQNYVTRQTKISLDPHTTGVGADLTEYKIDNGAWLPYKDSFGIQFLTAGNHTVYFRSKDKLGNLSAVKRFEVNLIDVTITREDFAMSRTLVYLLQKFDLRGDDPKPNEDFLKELLEEMGGYYKITDNLDEFIQSMRSDKFTTYIFATDSLVVNFADEAKITRALKELKSRIDKGEAFINMAGFSKVSGKPWEMFKGGWQAGDGEALSKMQALAELKNSAQVYAYGKGQLVEFSSHVGDLARAEERASVKSAMADLIEYIRPKADQLNAGEVIDSKLTFANSGDQTVTINVKEIFPAGGWIETKATQGEVPIDTRSYELKIPAQDKVAVDYLYRMPFEATDQKITAEVKATWASGVSDQTMLEAPYTVDADLNGLAAEANLSLSLASNKSQTDGAMFDSTKNQEAALDSLLKTIDNTPRGAREKQTMLDETVESVELAKALAQSPEEGKKGNPNEPVAFNGDTASYVTGGCELNPNAKVSGGWWILILVFLLSLRGQKVPGSFWGRGPKSAWQLLIVMLILSNDAHAGDTGLSGFNHGFFKPAADQSGIYNVIGTEIPPQFKIRTGFVTNIGRAPVTVVVPATGRQVKILDYFWNGDFLVSSGYWDHWSFGLALPVLFYGNGTDFNSLQSYKTAAFGDLRLDLKYRLAKESSRAPAIALFSQFSFPTGSRENWTGERGVTWEYRLVADKTLGDFQTFANLGFKLRKEIQVLASNYGDTFMFGVGGRYHLPWQQKSWAVESELIGESFFTNTRDAGVPVEWRLGMRKKLDEKKNIFFGVGRGLTGAVGAPQFRLFGGVQWNF